MPGKPHIVRPLCNKEEEETQVQDTEEKQEDPAAGLQQTLLRVSFKELTLRKEPGTLLSLPGSPAPFSSFPSIPAGKDHQHTQLSISEESPSQAISQEANKGQEDLL